MGADHSTFSTKGGHGKTIISPALEIHSSTTTNEQLDVIKKCLTETSTIRSNMHDLFLIYVSQIRELSTLVSWDIDIKDIRNSLFQTVNDFHGAISPYYGGYSATGMVECLKQATTETINFIFLAHKAYLKKQLNNAESVINQQLIQWQLSFVNLSEKFASADSSIDKQRTVGLLMAFIDVTKKQIIAIMERFNTQSLDLFKQSINYIRGIADVFTLAIFIHLEKSKK